MMIPQTARSFQITIRASRKHSTRLDMGAFIKVTGLAKLAAQAFRLSRIIEAGKGLLCGKRRGRPVIYTDITVMIIELLRAVWNLSCERIIKRFYDNPEYAIAAGCPVIDGELNIINDAHFTRRRTRLGPLPFVLCFVLLVRYLIAQGIISLKDVIIDATAVWTHSRKDAEARFCRYKLVWGCKLHLVIDRISMLPVMFGVTPANRNDCIMAIPLLLLMLLCYRIKPLIVRADMGYDTVAIRAFIASVLNALALIPKNFRKARSRTKLVPWLEAQLVRILNAPRSTIERLFGMLKQHQGLEEHHVVGFDKVARHCCVKLISVLLVAAAAHAVGKPQLTLSPRALLAHT